MFASMEDRRPYCDLPLIPNSPKDLLLRVQGRDGEWKTATEPLTLGDVVSSFDAVFKRNETAANRRTDYTATVDSGTVVVERLESWNAESAVRSCCAPRGCGLQLHCAGRGRKRGVLRRHGEVAASN